MGFNSVFKGLNIHDLIFAVFDAKITALYMKTEVVFRLYT